MGLGLIGLASHVVDMANLATELALLIGLGVGIDYALFIVTRYRDAYRENGGDVRAATELAMNTAGRAVLFAGTTVVIALLGMFALGVSFLNGMAIAASLGVLSCSPPRSRCCPRCSSFSGARVGATRARRGTRRRDEVGLLGALGRRHPAAAGRSPQSRRRRLMLALAAPALGLRLGTSDAGNDPASHTTRQAYDLLAQGFGQGFNGPLLLAVRLPATGQTPALARLTSAVGAHARAWRPSRRPAEPRPATIAAIAVYPELAAERADHGPGQHAARPRDPAHRRRQPVQRVDVGGQRPRRASTSRTSSRASSRSSSASSSRCRRCCSLIVFRSLLIPLQAAAMNLLSIGASLGIVQAIFQRGWLGGLFGVEPGPIEPSCPC